MPKRDPRDYGLTAQDRAVTIESKFGLAQVAHVNALLSQVAAPSEQLLGAIVFLARTVDDIPALVDLANHDRDQVLRAATVKDERG